MLLLNRKLSAILTLSVWMGMITGSFMVRAQRGEKVPQPAKAEELFAMANATRAQQGQGRLEWDETLAAAAMKHCLRMAAEGPISHRYSGEPDLTERAGLAGAHFSLIEENIAVGPYPGKIHQEWLESQGHRENLLNPQIDRIGVAVVAAQGVLFAVADYARGVQALTQTEVESKVGGLLRAGGLAVKRDTNDARAACRADHGIPSGPGNASAAFVMRWQDADLSRLPPSLVEHMASGRYRQAEVGSCPAHNVDGAFTTYRVAVLLY